MRQNTLLLRTGIILLTCIPASFALTAEIDHPDIVLALLLLLPSVWLPIVLTAAADSGEWRNRVRIVAFLMAVAFGGILYRYSTVVGTGAIVAIYLAGVVAASLLDLTVKPGAEEGHGKG